MGRFKDTLLKDLWIKSFSLIFAIFLWMSIVGGESSEELFVVPLTITNIPDNMMIQKDVVGYVNVLVRGQRAILNTLDAKKIDVELDLKDAGEGENTITLFPEEVKLVDGVTAIRVTPSHFTIDLSRLAQKMLPVEPNFIGNPARGYERKWTVTPPQVPVMGLEESLKNLLKIETAAIEESIGETQSFTVTVGLKPPNRNIRIKGAQKVRVDVQILEKTGSREFKNLSVSLMGDTEGVVLKPSQVTILLSGPQSRLDEMLSSMISVILPEQKKAGTYDVKPNVTLPEGFKLIRMDPESIYVVVEKKS